MGLHPGPSAHRHPPPLHAGHAQVAGEQVPSSGLGPAAGGLSLGKSLCFLGVSSQSARNGNGLDGLCFPSSRSLTGHGCQHFLPGPKEPGQGLSCTQVFPRWRSPQEVAELPSWQEHAAPFWLLLRFMELNI